MISFLVGFSVLKILFEVLKYGFPEHGLELLSVFSSLLQVKVTPGLVHPTSTVISMLSLLVKAIVALSS